MNLELFTIKALIKIEPFILRMSIYYEGVCWNHYVHTSFPIAPGIYEIIYEIITA